MNRVKNEVRCHSGLKLTLYSRLLKAWKQAVEKDSESLHLNEDDSGI